MVAANGSGATVFLKIFHVKRLLLCTKDNKNEKLPIQRMKKPTKSNRLNRIIKDKKEDDE